MSNKYQYYDKFYDKPYLWSPVCYDGFSIFLIYHNIVKNAIPNEEKHIIL